MLHGSPAASESWRVRSIALPEGRAGAERTLFYMWELVRQWAVEPWLLHLVPMMVRTYGETAEVDPRDTLEIAGRVTEAWVNRAQVLEDPTSRELIQDPKRTWERQAGDCDDFVIAIGGLTLSTENSFPTA